MTRLGSSIQHEGKLQSIYYFDIDIRFEGICLAITCNGLIFCLYITFRNAYYTSFKSRNTENAYDYYNFIIHRI